MRSFLITTGGTLITYATAAQPVVSVIAGIITAIVGLISIGKFIAKKLEK